MEFFRSLLGEPHTPAFDESVPLVRTTPSPAKRDNARREQVPVDTITVHERPSESGATSLPAKKGITEPSGPGKPSLYDMPKDIFSRIFDKLDATGKLVTFNTYFQTAEASERSAFLNDRPPTPAVAYLAARDISRGRVPRKSLQGRSIHTDAALTPLFERLYAAGQFSAPTRQTEFLHDLQSLPWTGDVQLDAYDKLRKTVRDCERSTVALARHIRELPPHARAAQFDAFLPHLKSAASFDPLIEQLDLLQEQDFDEFVGKLLAEIHGEPQFIAIAKSFAGRRYSSNVLHAFVERTDSVGALTIAAAECRRFTNVVVDQLVSAFLARSHAPSVHIALIDALRVIEPGERANRYIEILRSATSATVYKPLFDSAAGIGSSEYRNIYNAGLQHYTSMQPTDERADGLLEILIHSLSYMPAENRLTVFTQMLAATDALPRLRMLAESCRRMRTQFLTPDAYAELFAAIRTKTTHPDVLAILVNQMELLPSADAQSEFRHIRRVSNDPHVLNALPRHINRFSKAIERGDEFRMLREKAGATTLQTLRYHVTRLELDKRTIERETRALDSLLAEFDASTV